MSRMSNRSVMLSACHKVSYLIIITNMPNTTYMIVIFFKALVIYVVMLLIVRIMGKRQIGEIQPFEFVITLLIAEVAAIPLNDPHIPLHYGIVPMLALVLMHVFLSFLARHSLLWRRVMSGRSVIAIDNGVIHYTNIRRMNMNISDLIEAMRCDGKPDIMDIAYAIFETNGKICIIQKENNSNSQETMLPIPIILDGKWDASASKLVGVSIAQIKAVLKRQGIHSIRGVALLDVRQDGKVYVSTKQNTSFETVVATAGNW